MLSFVCFLPQAKLVIIILILPGVEITCKADFVFVCLFVLTSGYWCCLWQCPSKQFMRSFVTLVASVQFSSRVSYQMSPQIAFLNKSIVTLVTAVRFHSRVSFQVFPQIGCLNRSIVTLFAFVIFFLQSEFLNVSSDRMPEQM